MTATEILPELYRLPEVKAAIEAEQVVFVLDTPPLCEMVRSLGLTATVRPACKEMLPQLHGGLVAILPCTDNPSRRRANNLWKKLKEVAYEVHVLDPDFLRLSETPLLEDWLALQNGCREYLLNYWELCRPIQTSGEVSEAPLDYDDSWQDIGLDEVEEVETDWLIEQYLQRAGVTILAGLPGAGKSTFALELAYKFVTGGVFIGKKIQTPGKVLWLDFDQVRPKLKEKLLNTHGVAPSEIRFLKAAKNLNKQTMASFLYLQRERQYDLIIVDTLLDWLAESDMDSTGIMRNAMELVRRLADETGVSILVTAYPSKANATKKDVYALANSFMISAKVDVVSILDGDPHARFVSLHVSKNKNGDGSWDREFLKKNGQFLEQGPETRPVPVREQVFFYIDEHPGTSRKQILSAFPDLHYNVIDNHLRRLEVVHRIAKEKGKLNNEMLFWSSFETHILCETSETEMDV